MKEGICYYLSLNFPVPVPVMCPLVQQAGGTHQGFLMRDGSSGGNDWFRIARTYLKSLQSEGPPDEFFAGSPSLFFCFSARFGSAVALLFHYPRSHNTNRTAAELSRIISCTGGYLALIEPTSQSSSCCAGEVLDGHLFVGHRKNNTITDRRRG